jgi:hypothetical protein
VYGRGGCRSCVGGSGEEGEFDRAIDMQPAAIDTHLEVAGELTQDGLGHHLSEPATHTYPVSAWRCLATAAGKHGRAGCLSEHQAGRVPPPSSWAAFWLRGGAVGCRGGKVVAIREEKPTPVRHLLPALLRGTHSPAFIRVRQFRRAFREQRCGSRSRDQHAFAEQGL